MPELTTADALSELRSAGDARTAAVHAEGMLAIERTTTLADLTTRLLGFYNPVTGKKHSYSSAKEASEVAPEYLAVRARQVDAECARVSAEARYECARIQAWGTVQLPVGGP